MTTRYAPGVAPITPGSSLNPLMYMRSEKIERIKRDSILSRISTFKGFGKCGQAMAVRHEFDARDGVQELEHGGVMKAQRVIQPRDEVFMIGDQFGTLLAWPECDWMRIMDNDPEYINEVTDAYHEKSMLAFDSRAMAKLIGEAHPKNRGPMAGILSSQINLGTSLVPLTVDPAKVWHMHHAMKRVMEEHAATSSKTGRKMYAIVREGFLENIALNDRLSSYYHNGQCHTCVSPTMGESRTVDGIEYIKSTCLPYRMEGGSMVYPIIFGWDDALWFGMDWALNRKEGGPGDNNKYLELYWHLGLKLHLPRKVGVMWVKVDPPETGGM